MKNSASRTKLVESVRNWKESELGSFFYRSAAERLSESEISVHAPWLPQLDETDIAESEDTQNPIRSCWMVETDVDGAFGDLAEEVDEDSFSEIVTSLGGDEKVVEAVLSTLKQNDGRVMMLAHEGASEGFAVSLRENTILVAGMELEEEIIDEGLISIAFLSKNANAPEAPVVLGFPMIESQNNMFETLNASVMLLNSIRENENIDAELVDIIEKFNTDLADVLGELSIDEGTLTEKELDFLTDMFAGVFAGLAEEARLQSTETK